LVAQRHAGSTADGAHYLTQAAKDIPDYLLSSSQQGDRLVFEKEELEAFLEAPLSQKAT